MSRVFALTVGRNEANRYLLDMLDRCEGVFDGHLFFDDQSTDATRVLAASYGCEVRRRPADVPPFLAHEGLFRQGAWDALQEELRPEPGDWVLSIDCDEMLVAADPGPLLRSTIVSAGAHVGIVMPIPEVFGIVGETPMVRTDGFWGRIRGPRLFQYRPGGVFADKAMGSGSEPTYVAQGPLLDVDHGVYLMHLGYAHPDDRVAKHTRYTGLVHGHSDPHVQSILATPSLEEWSGPPLGPIRRVA